MNAIPTKNYQQAFFEKLELRFDRRSDMVLAISEHLNVGRDAVYRRLRGDTVLSADELMRLAHKYNIKLDEQHPDSAESPNISYPPGMEEIESELQYFQALERQCNMLASLPDLSLDYATPELPIHYELSAPTLLAFKVYIYGLTTWNFTKWKHTSFDPGLIDPEVYRIAERLVPIVFNLPGRELWSVGVLDVTLRQIENGVETGVLNDLALIERMFEEVEGLIQHMEAVTRQGKRFAPGTENNNNSPVLEVYHNEIANTNHVLIVKSRLQSFVFSTFVNPNYMISTDKRIQQQLTTWFDNLVENSNALSVNSAKYSLKYFATLRRSVAATRARVGTLI